MKSRTKTLIKLTGFALFVLVTATLVRMYQQARDAMVQISHKEHLDLAWRVIVHFQDDDKLIPPAVTTFEDSDGKEFQHSWRLIGSLEKSKWQDGLEWAEEYRLEEPWNSPDNLLVAKHAAESACSYFAATAGRMHEELPTHAGILVVVGEGGAWLKDETQTKKELMAKQEQIAMVYLPDSEIKLFEPKDITFHELIQLVKKKGRIHAYTAQGEFRILDEEWAVHAEQDLVPHASQ